MSNNQNTSLVMHQTALQASEFQMELAKSNVFKMNVGREVNFALQAMQDNQYLGTASIESVKQAVLNVALTGLTLNPVLRQAYLVPRRKGNQVIAVLDVSYQGLITKIIESGIATKVVAQVVHANDQFDFDESTDSMPIPHRKYYLLGKEPGVEIGVYAGIQAPDGGWQYKFLPANRVNQIMTMSESYKAFAAGNARSSIWNDHKEEMWKKTAVKYLWKYLPKSDTIEAIAKAIDESNFAHEVTDTQETASGIVVKPTNQGSDIAAQAAASMKKPISRADKKANAEIIKPQLVEDNPAVMELEQVLLDNFDLPESGERLDTEASEVLEAIAHYVDISTDVLTEYVSKKTKAYADGFVLAKKAPVDHIVAIIKKMV